MSEIERYREPQWPGNREHRLPLKADTEGRYMLYADHLVAIADRDAEIAKLTTWLKYAQRVTKVSEDAALSSLQDRDAEIARIRRETIEECCKAVCRFCRDIKKYGNVVENHNGKRYHNGGGRAPWCLVSNELYRLRKESL